MTMIRRVRLTAVKKVVVFSSPGSKVVADWLAIALSTIEPREDSLPGIFTCAKYAGETPVTFTCVKHTGFSRELRYHVEM